MGIYPLFLDLNDASWYSIRVETRSEQMKLYTLIVMIILFLAQVGFAQVPGQLVAPKDYKARYTPTKEFAEMSPQEQIEFDQSY